MDRDLFFDEDFSANYCRLPLSYPEMFLKKILSYLMEKGKGAPFKLAIDVGCGTGRSTRVLAPYFDKVIGMDLSESQLNEAQACQSPENVSYVICPVDAMTVEDNSVDLVTAVFAAHWFETGPFLQEVNRVLKPKGCLAMFTILLQFEIVFDDCSNKLTTILNEAFTFLMRFMNEETKRHFHNQYEDIFNAVPFKEKERVADLMITYKMSLQDIIKLIKAIIMYQVYKKENPDLAEEFIKNVEQRFRDVLRESSDLAIMDVSAPHVYILACK